VVADVRPGGSEGGGHESRVVGGLGRDAEVLQEVVERRRTTSVIEPRVVEEDSVVELRGALGGGQVARQVAELAHVVAASSQTTTTSGGSTLPPARHKPLQIVASPHPTPKFSRTLDTMSQQVLISENLVNLMSRDVRFQG